MMVKGIFIELPQYMHECLNTRANIENIPAVFSDLLLKSFSFMFYKYGGEKWPGDCRNVNKGIPVWIQLVGGMAIGFWQFYLIRNSNLMKISGIVFINRQNIYENV
jgi:hypothetical protein